jgi:hypothetical protein
MAPNEAPVDRLFSAAPSAASCSLPRAWDPGAPWEAQRLLSIAGTELRIAPFVVRKWGQLYIHPEAISIGLERLPATLFRITVVHNFRAEDRNPNLDECLAAIFLARRVVSRWEEAEDHPIECRSIEVLGYLDTVARRITPP